jgi:hypothetical protein
MTDVTADIPVVIGTSRKAFQLRIEERGDGSMVLQSDSQSITLARPIADQVRSAVDLAQSTTRPDTAFWLGFMCALPIVLSGNKPSKEPSPDGQEGKA